MTKKHFQALAKILGQSRTEGGHELSLEAAICDWLQTLNPRFNRATFIEAIKAASKNS